MILSSIVPAVSAALAPSSLPQINLAALGSVGVVGDLAGLSFYDPQNPPQAYSPGTSTLVSKDSSGNIAQLGHTNPGGDIAAICQNTASSTVYVGGNFTSIGGVSASNIALFNTTARTFSPLAQGLDGPVNAIACNGTSVYAGGSFQGPVGATSGYGGNVAVWNPSNNSWTAPIFAGLNGQVLAILPNSQGQDLVFGGSFSTSYSNVSNATGGSAAATINSLGAALTPISFSGSGTNTSASPTSGLAGFTDPTSIFCPGQADGPGYTWLLADAQLGSFTVRTGQALKVKGLRLANTHYQGRGTANFSLTVFPNDVTLPLTYNTVAGDVSSPTAVCQDTCPLSYNASLPYQDFIFPNNTYFEGFRINILGYYGEGAGLHLVQLLSEGSYAYAVTADNRAACSSGIARSSQAQVSTSGTWNEYSAYSCIPGIPQDILVAPVPGGTSPADASSLIWTPYITRGDNYQVFMTTPGCVGDGTCNSRTNVTLTITARGVTTQTVTIDQTNQDSMDSLIYDGPIYASDTANGGVTVEMKLAQGGAPNSGQNYRMLADLIYLIASNTTGNPAPTIGKGYGLFEWSTNNASAVAFNASSTPIANTTMIDSMSLRFSPNASVVALASSPSTGAVFVGGNFAFTNGTQISSNVVVFTNGTSLSAANGGLNGAVNDLVELNGTIYAAGNFTASVDQQVTGLNGLAQWKYAQSGSSWQPLPALPSGTPTELALYNNGQNVTVAVLTAGGAGLTLYEPWTSSWNTASSGFFAGNLTTFGSASPQNKSGVAYVAGQISAAASVCAPGGALLSKDDSGSASLAPFGYSLSSSSPVASSPALRDRALDFQLSARNLPLDTRSKLSRVARQNPSVNVTLPSAFNGAISSGTVVAGAFWSNGTSQFVVLGGNFTTSSGASNIALYDRTSQAMSSLPGLTVSGTVLSLFIAQNTLWIGGNCTTGSGQSALTIYNLSSMAPANANVDMLGYPSTSALVNLITSRPGFDNTIIVGGAFASVNGLACQSLCSWNAQSQQWAALGNGLYGVVGSVAFAGGNSDYLLAAGSFVLNDQQTSVAQYRFSDSSWSAVGTQSELAGPATAVTTNNRDNSNVFAAGQSSSGSTFLARWNGSHWGDLNNNTLLPGSTISQLLFVPLSQDHEPNTMIEPDRMLLVAGNLIINSTSIPCALFDGAQWHPYLVGTTRSGGPGAMSQLIYSIMNFSAAGVRHLATGLVILVSIAIGLGLVFLLVLIGILIAVLRRRRDQNAVSELASDEGSSQSDSHRPTSLLATVGAATAILLDKKGDKRPAPDSRHMAAASPASFDAPESVDDQGYEPDQTARVRFSFQAEHPGELTVSSGDDIMILEATDANWWLVQNSNHQRGLIPSSYLA